ncbi:MATE family efflux transporter [Paracoccus pacificus]|uniref:Multidrug-efflux transporter n=1 Tax=Paracoccus pacificus TaxID=1463598 RepID=A0ABW4RAV5_9RHOB
MSIFSRIRPNLGPTLALALPLVGSHLARMALGVTDTVMVGWYGVEPLAALVLATSYYFLLFMLGSGYGIGVMGVIATAIARKDETEARRATRMALWISILHSIIFLPAMWFSEDILLWLGQDPLIAALAQDYLRIGGLMLFPALCGLVLNSYIAALERARIVLWVTLAGLPLNILLNWLLIFGNWGFPQMGVAGSALASLTVQMAQLVLLLGYAERLSRARGFSLLQRFWRPDWQAFRRQFWLGLPVGLTLVAESGLFVASGVMMGWIGTQQLAAHGIAIQVTAIAFMIHLGIGNAATVRVGQAMGRRDQRGMEDATLTVLFLALLVVAVVVIIFLTMPAPLIAVYLDQTDPEAPMLIAIGSMLLGYAALFHMFDGLQAVALGLLRGVQDTRIPMYIAFFSYWAVGMPIAWVLAFPLGFGPPGLWLGLVASLVAASGLLLWRFWYGLRHGKWVARSETQAPPDPMSETAAMVSAMPFDSMGETLATTTPLPDGGRRD